MSDASAATASAALLCPQCGTALRSVKARGRSGYLLVLDQCGSCGGLWCDKWELFPIDSGEVDRLDPVDHAALHAAAPAAAGMRCPRCRIPLRRFQDPVLPSDVHLDRCPLCEGLWLNAGELRKYDAYRRRNPSAPKPISPETVEAISTACQHPMRWSTVQNLSANTVDGTSTADDAEIPETGKILWEGAAWMAVRALLGLLIRL